MPAMIRSTVRSSAGRIFAATVLPARVAAAALPRPTSLSERLAAFPKSDLPLEAPAAVYWNEHQIPFIEAQSDHDLAFTLGLVHAHLRLAQIEMLRRISQGRIAELVGPIAFELDHALRLLGFQRAAPGSVAAMPNETREWLDAFVTGLNHYVAHAKELPHEFTALRFECEAWTIADIFSIGRLAASDINWAVWLRLLPLRGAANWPELWRSITGTGEVKTAPGGDASPYPRLLPLLGALVARGSNAVAVAKSKSASGGSLLAGDPHLPILVPNIWLACGCRSPSFELVGLMLPGLPIFAIGRNSRIAWGGTNAHAVASELVDVSALPLAAVKVRHERIDVRWWPKETVAMRETVFGPVITDARLLKSGKKEALALGWLGHQPSDEFTAVLRISRARDWDEFRAAFDGFAIPGQNMVYADREGHIGKMIAATVPARPPGAPADLATPADAARDTFVTGADLPSIYDPAAGFVVSANEPPAEKPFLVGYFFSLADRAQRFANVLSTRSKIAIEDLTTVLNDVYSSSSVALRDALLPALRSAATQQRSAKKRRLLDQLAAWDGRYTSGSVGALAFELLLYHFTRRFFGRTQRAAFAATWTDRGLILRGIVVAAPEKVAAAVTSALGAAAEAMSRYRDWGDIHRLRLVHPFGALPIIGRRYRFADRPAAGGDETIFKTAYNGAGKRHAVRYGSSARYYFDLADPDRNYFVLLGGQDGWLGSANFLDQLPLWENNALVQVPLRPDTVERSFRHKIELIPAYQTGNGGSAAKAPRASHD